MEIVSIYFPDKTTGGKSMDNTAGLSAREVDESRRKFGENKLTKRKHKSIIRQFLENLGDPVIRILLSALAVNILFLF